MMASMTFYMAELGQMIAVQLSYRRRPVASEVIGSLFEAAGGEIKVLFEESAPFTSFDSPSPEVVAGWDASLHNQITSHCGGVNLFGRAGNQCRYGGDMIFPPHTNAEGEPVAETPMRLFVKGDLRETKDYFVKLVDLTSGWKIEVDRDSSLWQDFINRALYGDRAEFEAKPGERHQIPYRLATGMAHQTLASLHSNSCMSIGAGNDVVLDQYRVELWKDKEVSDLSVEASVEPYTGAVGEPLTYTVKITNGGPDRAEGVTLHAAGPAKYGFVFAEASQHCERSYFGRVTCELGTLEVDDQATVLTLVFAAPPASLQAQEMEARFDVTSLTYDLPHNNRASVIIAVDPGHPAVVTEPTYRHRTEPEPVPPTRGTSESFVRDASKDFDFPAGDDDPLGIWSDGTTLWVSDRSDSKVRAYVLATKERDTGKDIPLTVGSRPTGVWSDGTTMWVADIEDAKIYAYTLETKQRDEGQDFDTLYDSGNHSPTGIWSDGTTMWVADWGDIKMYAYNLETKQRVTEKDFERFTNLVDIWIDPSGNASDLRPWGIWSDTTTLWVTQLIVGSDADRHGSNTGYIYAYNLATKEREKEKDFDTGMEWWTVTTLNIAGNSSPSGIWSDGTTMWVVDRRDDKVYAYNLAEKQRDAGKDFDSLSDRGGRGPQGIWSDGTTMWVADVDQKVYAYDVETKQRDPQKDLNTLVDSGSDPPKGIWSDGVTMWVAYWGWESGTRSAYIDYGRVNAYDMATKHRDPRKGTNICPSSISTPNRKGFGPTARLCGCQMPKTPRFTPGIRRPRIRGSQIRTSKPWVPRATTLQQASGRTERPCG